MGKGRRSLIVIVLGALMGLMAFGVVGSAAWFTSQDAIEDNVIGAGTLDVQVFGGPFTVSNLAPGGDWEGPYSFQIRNLGTLPALYDISIGGISQTVSGFKNKINVRLLNGYLASDANCNTILVDEDTLPNVEGSFADTPWVGRPNLAPNGGWTDVWWMCFQLDDSAGNQYQGASATFDIVVDGYQPDAP
jgi:predicted ribosomally synthesized peptide with SipW-like signal peptide